MIYLNKGREIGMTNKLEISTLILRLILGITFFVHGYAKFTGGIENTVGWFSSIGLPGSLAYAVAIIELVGGFSFNYWIRKQSCFCFSSDSNDWCNIYGKISWWIFREWCRSWL